MKPARHLKVPNIPSLILLAFAALSCSPPSESDDGNKFLGAEATQRELDLKGMEKKIDSYLTAKGIGLFDKTETGHPEEAQFWGNDLPASQKATGALYRELGQVMLKDFLNHQNSEVYKFLSLRDAHNNLQAVAEFESLPYSNKKDVPTLNDHVLLHIILARPKDAKMYKMSYSTPAQQEKIGTVAPKIPYAGAFLMYKVFQTNVGDRRHYMTMTLHPENSALAEHYYPKFGFVKSTEPPHWRFCCGHLWMSVTYREFVKRLAQIIDILDQKSAKAQHSPDL